jgi:hypothetical protein
VNIQASVIIPTRDRPTQLKALLESFKLQEDAEALRWEIGDGRLAALWRFRRASTPIAPS